MFDANDISTRSYVRNIKCLKADSRITSTLSRHQINSKTECHSTLSSKNIYKIYSAWNRQNDKNIHPRPLWRLRNVKPVSIISSKTETSIAEGNFFEWLMSPVYAIQLSPLPKCEKEITKRKEIQTNGKLPVLRGKNFARGPNRKNFGKSGIFMHNQEQWNAGILIRKLQCSLGSGET